MAQVLSKMQYTQIKCPCCNRHLDKVSVIGEMIISRKCKSCKNNIVTEVVNNTITSNIIDAIENSKDVLNPKRFQTNVIHKDNRKS